VDAAYFPSGMGVAGVVIRSDHREAISGGAWPMNNLLDPATAEFFLNSLIEVLNLTIIFNSLLASYNDLHHEA
jgi:hypothetical protein